MRKRSQLHGLLFYPCSLNQREHEKTIFSAKEAIKTDFRKTYQNHLAAMQIIAESAKIYILNNYKKVKDWSDMEIVIVDNSEKETFYHKYKERKSRFNNIRSTAYDRAIRRMEHKRKRQHNPVKKISDVVLDTTDGDFSVKINDRWHNWIDNESVIILADYIEKHLK